MIINKHKVIYEQQLYIILCIQEMQCVLGKLKKTYSNRNSELLGMII